MAWRRWARLVGGGLLVVLGLIGWIIPVVPGWPLLIPGLALLATELPAAARLRDWLRQKKGTFLISAWNRGSWFRKRGK